MYQTLLSCFSHETQAIPICVIFETQWHDWLNTQAKNIQTWAAVNNWQNKNNQALLLPDTEGDLKQVLFILNDADDWLKLGILPTQLPTGYYQFFDLTESLLSNAYLAWGLGAYQFSCYRDLPAYKAKLIWTEDVLSQRIVPMLEAIYLVRDLINTPAEDMMPENLAACAKNIARRFSATYQEISGARLEQEYPCIAQVGRASVHAPRLLEIRFGALHHPKVTLIGKGVCFDTGGLNIKSTAGLASMKKDMAGAAHALALAQWIMAENLPLQLRVLLPLVDNAISGAAYRPGDVIKSRSGKTIEITNTDAEGRLILCDALTAAVEESPDVLIDFATLTGAARVAVGTEIAAFFSNDDSYAAQIILLAKALQDPCWQMPLHQPYRHLLESHIADLNNAPDTSYAGAITAALFLQVFVPDHIKWLHFDMMAFNLSATPGKPKGGEAMGLRVMYQWLKNQFVANQSSY